MVLVISAILVVVAVLEAAIVLPPAFGHADITVGLDARLYVERTASWMAGDGFYRARQLTGLPYIIEFGDAFYPPPIVLLLAPFALGLPLVFWWVVPLTAIGLSFWVRRPAWWAWPLILIVLIYPRTWLDLVYGNPAMWAIAASVAGFAFGWPAVGAFLKPQLALFALSGIRHRSWWFGLGAALLISIPLASMWADYVTALWYAVNTWGFEYTLGDWPIALCLAFGAWTGRRRSAIHDERPTTG